MAILGNLISRSLRLRKQFDLPVATPEKYQRNTLRQLLERARYTAFGKEYGFSDMLDQELDFMKAFRKKVPVHNYNKMYEQWWYRCQQGEENGDTSLVEVDIEPQQAGCLLTLTHRLHPDWGHYAGRVKYGWETMLEKLAEHLGGAI